MEEIGKVLERKMSRREFLSYLGLLLLTITGISGLARSFSTLDKSTSYYGNSSYGGKKKGGMK